MRLLAAAASHLAVGVDNSPLLHAAAAAAASRSARGAGTAQGMLASCKQLLYVVLTMHINLLLVVAAVKVAAGVKCAL